MSGADWGLLVAVIVLFAASAVLALSETAFTKMSRIRAIQLEEEGKRGAGKLAHMLEEPARTLNAVLLAVLVCQFTAATSAMVRICASVTNGPSLGPLPGRMTLAAPMRPRDSMRTGQNWVRNHSSGVTRSAARSVCWIA